MTTYKQYKLNVLKDKRITINGISNDEKKVFNINNGKEVERFCDWIQEQANGIWKMNEVIITIITGLVAMLSLILIGININPFTVFIGHLTGGLTIGWLTGRLSSILRENEKWI